MFAHNTILLTVKGENGIVRKANEAEFCGKQFIKIQFNQLYFSGREFKADGAYFSTQRIILLALFTNE